MGSEEPSKPQSGAVLVSDECKSPKSSLLSPQAVPRTAETSPQRNCSYDTSPISFANTEWQNSGVANGPQPQSAPTGSLRDIYWRSPATMVACFLLGVLTSLGHHLYYSSLDGDLVGDVDDQQRRLRYGTTFAFITQISLVGSVGFAYTQWLWKTLRRTRISVSGLDAAFSADAQLISLLNAEMLWKIKLGSFLALVAWCLPLPSLITPATLFVIPGTRSVVVDTQVPCLSISTNDTNQYARFEYSSPLIPNTVKGVNDTSNFFVGPRTIISRLSTATASTGRILSITPPFMNSSYSLQFYGPTVKCEEANSTAAAIIDNLLNLKATIPDGNFRQNASAYFAFVPNDYILNGGVVNDTATVESVSEVRMQRHINGSNQLWATYKRYVYNSTGGKNTETHHTVCRLYNASYDVQFQFEAGTQLIQKNGLQILNEIDYPRDDAQTATNFAAHSYSAVMWVLTDQLVGSMVFWVDNTTSEKFSEIDTPIEHNSLLGSVDLDPFFDFNSNLYLQNSTTQSGTNLSDQRLEDIALAKNRTLNVLIEELSFNTTISLMSSNLLSPGVNTTVQKTTSVNIYAYNAKNLFLAYGLAIFFAFIANILGIIAYIQNGAAHDRAFSSILGATREAELGALFCHKSHGMLPVPKETKRALLKFRNMDQGGWSFRRTEIETEAKRRRRSLLRRKKSRM